MLTFIDISRAHLHSDLKRAVYIRAPKEDKDCKEGECWLLRKAMYGLKDAGSSFDQKTEDIMARALSSKHGAFSPCIYRVGELIIWRHGDDFVTLGERGASRKFAEDFGEHLIVKVRGVLGPSPEEGYISDIVVLNRIVRRIRQDVATEANI